MSSKSWVSLRATSWGALVGVALLAPLLLTPDAAMAATPNTLVMEGTLHAQGGGPAADGQYVFTFGIYTAEKGGAPIWKEGPVAVGLAGGRFTRTLGLQTPLTAAVLGDTGKLWMGLTVAPDPEFERTPLASVLFAKRAELADGLACSGCVDAKQLANGGITAEKVGFTYAGSKTKGGPATSAADLVCTGCVSVDELKIDKDLDLGGNALKAAKVSAASVSATTVSATSFLGDGSKLSGIKIPSGECEVKGEVVKGINADGTLKCIKAMDPSALPPDGIDEISNGLIANQFIDETKIDKPVPIPDNNPTGVASEILFPDIGVSQKLDVWVNISNSDMKFVTVSLFDPNNVKYVLYDKGAPGKTLVATYPSLNKPVSGDLTTWVGKNPKGKWRLLVVDTKFLNNGDDGAINGWGIKIQTLSNKKIQVNGNTIINQNLTTKGDGQIDKKLGVGGDLTVGGSINSTGALKVNGWDLDPAIKGSLQKYSLVFSVRDPSYCPKGFNVESHADLRGANAYVYLNLNRQGLWMGAMNGIGYGQTVNYIGFNYNNVNGGKGAMCWKTWDAPTGRPHLSMFTPNASNQCPTGYQWMPRDHVQGNNSWWYITSSHAGTYIGYEDTWDYACRSDEGQGCQRRNLTSHGAGVCWKIYGVTEEPKYQNGVYPVMLGLHTNPAECPKGWNLKKTADLDGSNGWLYNVTTENASIWGGMSDWWYTGKTYMQTHWANSYVNNVCWKFFAVTGRPYYQLRTTHYTNSCPAGFMSFSAANLKGWNGNGYIQSTQAGLYVGGLHSWAHADHEQGQVSHNFTSHVNGKICLKMYNVVED